MILSSLLLDWDLDSLSRKYNNTYCRFEHDGQEEVVFVSEIGVMSDDNPSLICIHLPEIGTDTRWKDGPGKHGGAIHANSMGSLKLHGVAIPTGQLKGLAHKAKYFCDGYGALFFGGRKLNKTFRWGIDKDNWYIHRAANAVQVTVPKIIEFVMSSFSRKEHKEYKLLSEEVAVVGGVIKILGVTVGFLDGTQAKVKNAAVGKILSDLEPTWTISYW